MNGVDPMIKKFLVFFLVLFSVIIFSSCQKTTTERQLSLMISGLQQPSEKVFLKTFIRLFEAETGINVNLTYILPADLIAQIEQEQSSEQYISDIIMVDTANMYHYIDGEWMSDISEIMAQKTDRTITNLFDAYTNVGTASYFVPVSYDIYISIYNIEALPYIPSTVEVLRNQEDVITQIKSITWEEFSQWAITIKEQTGYAKTGFPMSPTNSQLIYPLGGLALAYGADSFPLLNTNNALNAWNLIADMASHGAILQESILSTVNQPTSLLSSGSLWLSFGHMGPIGTAYNNLPSQYVLGPAPKVQTSQKAGSTAGAWTFGIPKNAPHNEEAKVWLDFITEPEINYLYCSQLGGVISPVKEVVNQLGSSNTDKIMAIGLSSFDDQVEISIVNTSDYTSWTEVKNLYIALYQRLLSGDMLTIEEANAFQLQLDALKK